MHSFNHIVSNVSWVSAGTLFRMGVGLGIGLLVARYLGPGSYGTLNYSLSLVALFSALPILGLDKILIREFVNDPERKEAYLGTAFAMQTAMGLVAAMLAIATSWVIDKEDPEAFLLVVIISATLPLNSINCIQAWFESQVQGKVIVLAQIPAIILIAAIRLILVLTGAPLFTFAIAAVLESLSIFSLLLIALNYQKMRMSFKGMQWELAKHLLRESWPLLLAGISVVLYMKVDLVMLGQMQPSRKEVGLYAAAVRISELWYFIPTAIVSSLFPNIIKIKSRSETEYLGNIQRLFNVLVIIAIGVSVVVTLSSNFIVSVLFGAEYEGAGVMLAIHTWALCFVGLGVASGAWYITEKLSHLILQRSIIGLVCNIGLNWWLIPSWGGIGAAVATLVSYIVAAYGSDCLNAETKVIFNMESRALCFFLNMNDVKLLVLKAMRK